MNEVKELKDNLHEIEAIIGLYEKVLNKSDSDKQYIKANQMLDFMKNRIMRMTFRNKKILEDL